MAQKRAEATYKKKKNLEQIRSCFFLNMQLDQFKS